MPRNNAINTASLPHQARRVLTVMMAALAVLALTMTLSPRQVRAQTCRTKTNLPIQNLLDLNASTVTNLGSNTFRLHFAYVSDPSITLICAGSGLTPPCDFDGVYARLDLSGNITSANSFGSCNLKSDITTTGDTSVVLGYELKFELNGVPSKQTFQAGMSTNIPVGSTVSLSSVLL